MSNWNHASPHRRVPFSEAVRLLLGGLLLLLLGLPSTDAAAAASLLGGYGGNKGFGTEVSNTNGDDISSPLMEFPAVFPNGLNFFYPVGSAVPRGFYVNVNGNITFGGGYYGYVPSGFGSQNMRMIAGWWTDLDTRNRNSSSVDNRIYYAQDLANKRVVLTWYQVGYYSMGIDKPVTFQIVLTDRSNVRAGDFDVEFRYNSCIGGSRQPEAGFDAGDYTNYQSLPNSRVNGALFCSTSNVGSPGIWRFQIRSGGVALCGNGVLEDGEQCDDHNTTANDGCSADCLRETDSDSDGVVDPVDNCVSVANTNQANSDGDSFGNLCDPCPTDPGNDNDNDGRCYASDNCPTVYNPTQANSDGDSLGDACDGMNNSPPVMSNDTYSVNQNTLLTVAAPGVLMNDASVHTLSATVVTAPANGTLTLSGNGAFTFQPNAGFVGTTSFTYRATDATNSTSATATATITVISVNSAPVANAGANQTVAEGSSVSFSGSNTDAGAGQTWTYAWNFGDGGTASGSLTPTHTYINSGSYTVTLTITDNGGLVGTDTMVVTVNNVAPTVTNPGAQSLNEGGTLNLTANFYDPGNDSYTATLNWGDTTSSSNAVTIGSGNRTSSFSHAYPANGSYAASLSVFDGTSTTTVNFTVTVNNVAPTVTNPGAQSLNEGSTLSLTASFSDPGNDAYTVTFNWGEGSPSAVNVAQGAGNKTASSSHVYANHGTFSASIVVNDGTTSTTVSFTVTVGNVAPVLVDIANKSVAEGTQLDISTTFTDPGSDTHTVTITWGDSSTSSFTLAAGARTINASHVWTTNKADNSAYAVSLSVSDGTVSDSTSFTVAVSNVAPSVTNPGNKSLNEGGTLSLTVNYSDPGTDAHTVTFTWGDGQTSTVNVAAAAGNGSAASSHTYASNGTYSASVAVNDGTTSTSAAFTVTVANVAPVLVAIGAQTVNEGAALSVSTTFTDPGSDTHTVTITWGDTTSTVFVLGAGSRAISSSHTWANNGVYPVSLQLSDGTATPSISFNVTVNNVAPVINAFADQIINEGATVNLSTNFTDPGTLDTHSATVNWGDGSAAENWTLAAGGRTISRSHVFSQQSSAAPGYFTVTVTLGDGTTTSQITFKVSVANVAPTVATPGAASVAEGSLFTLSTTFVDPGTDSHTATVNWGDGSAAENWALGAGARALSRTHTFTTYASRTVTVTVSDGIGSDDVTFVVTVNNVAPGLVAFTPLPSANEGAALTLSTTSTDAGTGDTHTMTVHWGDTAGDETWALAAGARGVSRTHTYVDNGLYAAWLKVSDGNLTYTYNFNVTINNVSPSVNAIGTINGNEGAVASVTATFSDPGLDIQTVTFVWGDGTPDTVVTLPAASGSQTVTRTHTYADNLDYAGSVKVNDETTTITTAFTAHIVNVGPSFEVGGAIVLNEGGTASLEFTITDPGAASEVYTASVDWGDGTVQNNLVISPITRSFVGSHVYTDNRAVAYTIAITITDGDGGSGSDSTTVTVNNVPPSLSVAGAAGSVNEGSLYSLAGVTYDDVGVVDGPHTAKVNWGCGTADENATVNVGSKTITASHTYPDSASCTVTVKVTDKDGATTTGSFPLTIQNVSPTVALGTNQPTSEGSSLTLSIDVTDPGLTSEVYLASVNWGDGSAVENNVGIPAATRQLVRTHVYADNRATPYTISVTVTDGDGGSGSKTANVTVNNVAPVVEAGVAQTVVEGQVVYLTNVVITDPAGASDTYSATIDWGDGSAVVPGVVTQATRTVAGNHVYVDNGVYTVRVSVADGDGGTHSDSFVVTVNNSLPVVEAGPNRNGVEGTPVALEAATFTDAGSSDAHTATIDWGDGTPIAAGAVDEVALRVSGSHTYADNGNYTVVVKVTDDGGTAQDTFVVTVANATPVVLPGPDQVVAEGAPLNLPSTSYTDGGSVDTHTVSISWGDGTSSNVAPDAALRKISATHVYADNNVGGYVVTITVTDNNLATSSASFNVTVNNALPVVAAMANQNKVEGALVSLAPAVFTDGGSVDTHTASIDWGDGTIVAGVVDSALRRVTGTHVYADNGNYTVKVTVTDKDSGVGVGTFIVAVTNALPVVSAGGDRTLRAVLDTLQVAATFSDAGSADTHTAKINWGDGSALANGVVNQGAGTVTGSHVYTVNGTYTVTVTVTDDNLGVGTATFVVTVKNVAPTLSLITPNGGEILHGVATIRFTAGQTQGKALTVRAYLGATEVTLIEGNAVTPPNGGAGLEVTRTFASTAFADGTAYKLRLVAVLTSDATSSIEDLSTANFTIDNTAPVVTIPAGELAPVLEQAMRNGTVFAFHPTIVDNLDPSPEVVVTSQLGTYPLGTTTVTWTVTDHATNQTVRTATVQVRDTTAPTLTQGANITKEATAPEGTPAPLSPTTADICDADVTLVHNARALYPLGVTTVTFTATDDSANQTVRTLTVTVVDTTPPVLTLPVPASSAWEQSHPRGRHVNQVTLPVVTYTDNGWGPAGLTCTVRGMLADPQGQLSLVTTPCNTPIAGVRYFPHGETVLTYKVVDGSGNVREKPFTVVVDDVIPPDVSISDDAPASGSVPVNLVLNAEDAGDDDLLVSVQPPPSGSANGEIPLDANGNAALIYDEEGIYDVTITVTDNAGNTTEIVLDQFYVDLTPPALTIGEFPVVEVSPQNEAAGYPIFFQGEQLTPTFLANDPTSGLVSMTAKLTPGLAGDATLLSRSWDAVGTPLYGPKTSGQLVCADRAGVCADGVLDLTTVALGPQKLVLEATDVVARRGQLEAPFRLLDLSGGIEVVRGRIAGYRQRPLSPRAQQELTDIDALLLKALGMLDYDYLGGGLLSVERATKRLIAEALVAELPTARDDAELLARGAYAQTRLYWMDVAVGTVEEEAAANYLASSLQLRAAGAHNAAVLACENAFFYARNAEVPYLADDIASSMRVLRTLTTEMSLYQQLRSLPAYQTIADVAWALDQEVLWKYEDLEQNGSLRAIHHLEMLLDLQDLTNLLFEAEEQGVWVRSWQWGLAQMTRETVILAKAGAAEDIPEENPGHCKLDEAQVEYDRGIGWLEERDVDQMMKLYSSPDIRCLMLEIYQIAGYQPVVDPAAYECVVTGCGVPQ